MKKSFVLLIMASLHLAAHSQETKPTLLPEPANWEFERFELPPSVAPRIVYKGIEELRFPPGFAKKDTATYFTYAFIAQLDNVVAISQDDIKDYLVKYYKGLCNFVARDRKLSIDTTQIAATVEQKKDLPANDIMYNASVNLFGVFADGAALKLNLEIKSLINPVARKTYLVLIASPLEKTDAVWKKLYEIRQQFTMPK